MKQPLTESRKYNILRSVQVMQVLSECIKIEFQSDLIDTNLKNPLLNQHAKRINESANAIQINLSGLVKNRDREYFANDYAVEMHRLISHFISLDVSQIRDFLDGVDDMVNHA